MAPLPDKRSENLSSDQKPDPNPSIINGTSVPRPPRVGAEFQATLPQPKPKPSKQA